MLVCTASVFFLDALKPESGKRNLIRTPAAPIVEMKNCDQEYLFIHRLPNPNRMLPHLSIYYD